MNRWRLRRATNTTTYPVVKRQKAAQLINFELFQIRGAKNVCVPVLDHLKSVLYVVIVMINAGLFHIGQCSTIIEMSLKVVLAQADEVHYQVLVPDRPGK